MGQEHHEQLLKAIRLVDDPELPSISIVELGMLREIQEQNGHVKVTLLPTFSGCPALDQIEAKVKEELKKVEGVATVEVQFCYDPPWTTNRLEESAREKLKAYGISPPPADHKEGDPWVIECPYCGSDVVTMDNLFGPTACRSLLYCRSCRNPFEAMKPVASL